MIFQFYVLESNVKSNPLKSSVPVIALHETVKTVNRDEGKVLN